MKGILESIPEFLQVAVAIAIGIILIVMTLQFFGNMQQSNTLKISGNRLSMAKVVAQQIQSCWKDHRYGLDSESDVCKTIQIDSGTGFSEKDVVQFLDCSSLPDNDCVPDDCSKCVSDKYDNQDKIRWDVQGFPSNISITYSGSDRTIFVEQLYTPLAPSTTSTTKISHTITTTQTSSFCQYTPEQLADLVNSSEMVSNLQYLTQQPRFYGSDWNKQTADYIQNKLSSYNLQKAEQESFPDSGHNVVGQIGVGKSEVVVIGGHRDSVHTPGAVDNGGGAVVVMETARVLSMCKDNLKDNIRFVLFDGEEEGLYGSRAYMRSHSSDNIVRMMNFDCEGAKEDSVLQIFRTAGDLATSADQCCKSLNIPCRIVGGFDIPGASSDHASFEAHGIQYIYPLTLSCDHYHTSRDNMSEVDGEKLKWAAQVAVCIAAKNYIVTH
jgi:hypothetical protein